MTGILRLSNLRRKLLAHAFTHPDGSFYLRELAGRINVDPGNLSRELKELERDGLFRSETRGRNKLFRLNTSYPLYEELRSIVVKTDGVEGSLRRMVQEMPGVTRAFIHGSFASGKEKQGSDIDLVLVGRSPERETGKVIRELEQRLKREINISTYTETEFAVERANPGGFLALVLQGKIVALKGDPHGD